MQDTPELSENPESDPSSSGKIRQFAEPFLWLTRNEALALTDVDGISARAYQKTAAKAREAENYRREAELLEKAILIMGIKPPSTLRLLAAALYKSGEYRAASLVLRDPTSKHDGGQDFVNRLRAQVKSKYDGNFTELFSSRTSGQAADITNDPTSS